MAATAPTPDITPLLQTERHEFLDALRGFALLGIILANMISLSLYLYLPEEAKARLTTAPVDKGLDFLELVFIEAKFYTIFSVLFGIGFSILLTRTEAKGIRFSGFFLRRMFFLLLIGALHAVLFWHNDILMAYALCGALLLPFVRASDGAILLASAVALLSPFVIKCFGGLPPDLLTAPRDWLFARFGFTLSGRVATWSEGSWGDIGLLNFSASFGQLDYLVTSGMLLKIFGCFLIGFCLGRSAVHARLDGLAPALRRVAVGGLVLGLPLNAVYARTFESESLLHEGVAAIGVLPLSAGYVSLLALLWLRGGGRRLLGAFIPVGRMALTNYVAQSAMCMFIFRGVGLGLGGDVGPAVYLPIGLAIYALQVALSRLWLRQFQFGPLEWLWRTLTYGAAVPLRRTALA